MLASVLLLLCMNLLTFFPVAMTQRGERAQPNPDGRFPCDVDGCRLLTGIGGVEDADVLCAAMLHDVVEDTAVTTDEVRAAFGDAVADLVAEVTDDKSLPKAVRKQLQVEHAPHLSPGACLIKICDKISNIRDFTIDPPPWDRERLVGYIDWSIRVIDGLSHRHAALDALFIDVCQQARPPA